MFLYSFCHSRQDSILFYRGLLLFFWLTFGRWFRAMLKVLFLGDWIFMSYMEKAVFFCLPVESPNYFILHKEQKQSRGNESFGILKYCLPLPIIFVMTLYSSCLWHTLFQHYNHQTWYIRSFGRYYLLLYPCLCHTPN